MLSWIEGMERSTTADGSLLFVIPIIANKLIVHQGHEIYDISSGAVK